LANALWDLYEKEVCETWNDPLEKLLVEDAIEGEVVND